MNTIHERAIIGKAVQLGDGNTIGPNAYIEDGVSIGSNNTIGPNVVIYKGTTIGDGNSIHTGVVIGDIPQDVAFKNSETFVIIGNNNRLREYVTIHRGTKEGTATVLGNDNFLMGYTHVAHNCSIGNGIVTVNTAVLGGYVTVEDGGFISASVVIHQFCRIGMFAIVSGLSAVNMDVPPFLTCGGRPAVAFTVNVVGLKRAGMKPEVRKEIKQAYKLFYQSNLNKQNALAKIEQETKSAEARYFVKFIGDSERGVISADNSGGESFRF